ncbi:MAG: zinc ABC transporter substrate-binding protein [Planctomycetaceae bacterium]|nr:zinc ABC transporter substrate-binding protein [Planctomycetaceae bacterium]
MVLVALVLIGLALSGCGVSEATPGQRGGHTHGQPQKIAAKYAGSYPIQVVCTTGMVADQVRNVGGKHVQVVTLMGAGVDPHLYKASPADVSQLNRADIIFYSGLHLEGKLAELLERMASRKPTVAVAERIDEAKVLHDEHGAPDPHVWFNVSHWSEAAGAVRDALAEFDPKHADDYKAASETYQAQLAVLHLEAKEQLATIPAAQRVLVTAHDAFQYFGQAYGLEVRGIQGISTDSEAGVKHVNDLVDFLVQRKIKAVFVETSVANQNVKALIEGCAAQNHKVEIGGELFSDAMGEEGTPEGTYQGMVGHNVKTIVGALK